VALETGALARLAGPPVETPRRFPRRAAEQLEHGEQQIEHQAAVVHDCRMLV
jgi:hypothetical protein